MAPAPVHLWRVELDVGAEAEARLLEGLAADELTRAESFTGPQARRRFVVARGTLRMLLGDLLDERPRSLRIEAGPGGKPRLVDAEPQLHFNVSHSGDLALICIAEEFEVGVDLEQLRPVPSAVEIAKRRFAPEEARFVEEGDGSDVARRFLLCWTRKEALAKAIGSGLSFDLRSFAVPLEEPGGIVSLGSPDSGLGQQWRIVDVPLGDGHIAALALPSHREEIDVVPSISRAIG